MARGLGPGASANWPGGAVVYEIYPRSFQDGDGDGIGDLPGIRSRLPYLEWLGVDAIWLAPIYASPLADYGYDVSDHTAIAPEFGTEGDFDLLVADAHDRGIRVVLDLVVSHTSIEHPWFRDRPDFYVLADGPEPPNNWLASFGGPAWSPDPVSGRLYLHSFYPEQPDLDWRNPDVREAMAAVVRHWVGRGVDGFRIDAVDRMVKDAALRDDPPAEAPFPLPMPEELRHLDLIHSRDSPDMGIALATLREAAGDVPLIGEVYLPVARILPYLDYLDGAFAFDLLHAEWDAEQLGLAIERSSAAAGVAWVTSNHDFPRVATRWGEENARAAAVLLLTLGGTAFVYQGEELGMVDGEPGEHPRDRFGRDGCRRPMQWDASDAGGFTSGDPWLEPVDPGTRNADAQTADGDSILNLFRRLIELRRGIEGDPVRTESPPETLVFDRGRHRIAINLGNGTATVALPEGASVVLETEPGTLRPGAGGVEVDGHGAIVARVG
ncbi:MAG: alpha-amylase family glycosyl hydrolase [Solirubrobacterales bacterium]